MNILIPKIIILCCLLLAHSISFSQEMSKGGIIKQMGMPFITTYNQASYEFGSQNFNILTGDDKRIYFANTEGILVFDGVHWTKLLLPKKNQPYSLTKTADGTIFVGAVNEIGYLTADLKGNLRYNSLIDLLDFDKPFTVWYSYTINNEVYFATSHHLFVYTPPSNQIRIISSPDSKWSTRVSHNRLYAYRNDSLYQLVNDSWEAIRPSKLYADPQVQKVLFANFSDGQTLVVSNQGFFDFKDDTKIAIDTQLADYLAQSTPYNVFVIQDKYLAICTLSGLLITTRDGTPIQFFNKERGLSSNLILNATLGPSGILWVGTFNGIDAIEVFSPFSVFDSRHGIDGNINQAEWIGDYLYLATSSGVYRQKWLAFQEPLKDIKFEKITSDVTWALLKTQEGLIALTQNNIRIIEGNIITQQISGNGELYWAGVVDNNQAYLGSSTGKIMCLTHTGTTWQVSYTLETAFPDIRYITSGPQNTFWLSNRSQGIYHFRLDKNTNAIQDGQLYTHKNGLPDDVENYVYQIHGHQYFATLNGFYQFNETKNSFEGDSYFAKSVGNEPILVLSEDTEGNIYYFSDHLYSLSQKEGDLVKQRLTNNRISEYYLPISLTADNQKNIILGSYNAFIHIDGSIISKPKPFTVTISGIESLNYPDSVIFNGFGKVSDQLSFKPDNNAFRFSFSSSFYENAQNTLYKWKLNGSDSQWSKWSKEHTKDYTNLPFGGYTFQVKAKNIYGIESEPTQISFTIDRPWYFRVWAIGIYVLLLFGFVWLITKLYTRKLQQDQKRLEKIIQERTTEISKQKEQVEESTATIASQRDLLLQKDELKTRFFLNISHELRTPLTLIMGTTEQVLKGKHGPINHTIHSNLSVSMRNSQRLLKMVNNILDISKLESGKMLLNISLVNLSDLLKKVVSYFSSKFNDKNIRFINSQHQDGTIYLDRDKVETIFVNLIANAIKFTPQHGNITISLTHTENTIEIAVTDNGTGIPDADINHIFDRFYQSTIRQDGEGTGVGLALTKELVDLHQGSIVVENKKPSGVTFTVSFLKGDAHLSPSQLADLPFDDESSLSEAKYPLPSVQKYDTAPQEEADSKPNILLVEDNPDMSYFIRQILEDHYRVAIADNGKKALALLEENQPDLIITDYMMPEMDGYQLAVEIKKDDALATIPIIFLTARTEMQDKIEVLNLGVDDYLFKPFNAEVLKVRIRNLLKNKNKRVEYWIEQSIDPRDIEWKEFPSKLKLTIDTYIKEHLKSEIKIDQLVEATGISERSLYRKVKANTGLSPMEYIKEYKLRAARSLLENKTMHNVSEVADSVGFNYLSYFSKSYKQRFGIQPSNYFN